MKVSPIYTATLEALKRGYRIIIHEGGTRSGKTYNNVLLLEDIARLVPNFEISVISQSLPHLKRGARKDFLGTMKKRGMFERKQWHDTDNIYRFAHNESHIEFFSADNEGKVRGPSRDILFINEANLVDFQIYRQLAMRTRKHIIIDYNPSDPLHWIYDRLHPREDAVIIKSTYLDNYDFLTPEQISDLERTREEDPEFWRVFGLGKRGRALKGQIYTDWNQCHLLPADMPHFYALDFGFSSSKNALVKLCMTRNKVYAQELLYRTGMGTEELAKHFRYCNITAKDLIIADSEDARLIEELNNMGFTVKPAIKGPGSVRAGIKKLASMDVNVTYESKNIWKEYTYYRWALDKMEEPLEVPIKVNDHLMDAIRMGVYTMYMWGTGGTKVTRSR